MIVCVIELSLYRLYHWKKVLVVWPLGYFTGPQLALGTFEFQTAAVMQTKIAFVIPSSWLEITQSQWWSQILWHWEEFCWKWIWMYLDSSQSSSITATSCLFFNSSLCRRFWGKKEARLWGHRLFKATKETKGYKSSRDTGLLLGTTHWFVLLEFIQ